MSLNRPTRTSIAVAASTAAALAAAPALADPAIRFTPLTPAEHSVRWDGADGPNLVGNPKIDGLIMLVRATTNSPVTAKGYCPGRAYGNWGLGTEDSKKLTEDGHESAEVDDTSTIRTGEDGGFTLRFTAPSRAGMTESTKVPCVKKDGEKVVDQHDLTLAVTAVGDNYGRRSDRGAASGSDFFFDQTELGTEGSGSEEGTRGRTGIELQAKALLPNLGFELAAGVDPNPELEQAHSHMPIGLAFRYQRLPETLNVEGDGTEEQLTNTYMVALRGSWAPQIADSVADIRARLDLGAGICVAAGDPNPEHRIPDTQAACANGGVGFEIGGDNLAGTIGASGTLSTDELFNGVQVGLGVNIRL